jgi:hypothetical protein
MNRVLRYLLPALTLAAVACGEDKVRYLEQVNQELAAERRQQDSLLNDFLSVLNEVEDNLDQIREHESLIVVKVREEARDRKQVILDDIQQIDELMTRNRDLIAVLDAKVSGSEQRLGEFRGTVTRLRAELEARTVELASLRQQMESGKFAVQTLSRKFEALEGATRSLQSVSAAQAATLQAQSTQIGEQIEAAQLQDEALHEVYYIVGTIKELKRSQVIMDEGGFIGIGGALRISPDADPAAFTRADLRSVSAIPVNTRKVRLLTNHPSDSYEWSRTDKEVERLEIRDPARFWKHSRYLVMVLN